MSSDSNMADNDSLFVYVLFTFQSLASILLLLTMLCQCGSTEGRYTISQNQGKFGIKFMCLAFFLNWTMNTYELVEEIQAKSEKPFNPYSLLHIDDDGSFNTDEIKRAFRRLSLKYHPDKVDPEKVDPEKAKKRFENLQKAHATLTKEEAFNNYRKFGDPDGPKAVKALELALPTWILAEEFRPTLITAFFTLGIVAALAIKVW